MIEPMGRRVLPLDEVRADGWFERLGDGAPQFRELCEALGEKVVAFAIVAGVRITAVALDRRAPDASVVSFCLGDEEDEHQLPLGELRRRLASSLLADEPFPTPLSASPTAQELQRFIGYRYLLLAPLFGLTLCHLELADEGEEDEDVEPPRVLVDLGAARDLVPLSELRQLIKDRVRTEGQAAAGASPFAIDLNVVPKAAEANAAGQWSKTIELLGAWPGPLSMLMRTREGQELAPEVKASLARALGLLGTAYVELGNYEWAEEVLRLGIQWGQAVGGDATADLFRRLGHAHVIRDRHGQAIGLLRRALALGAAREDVLPLLARSFVARERFVAAAICVEEARSLGVDGEELEATHDRATEALGETWARFRAVVPASFGER